MRKRLIIISDLWGREKSEWLINYTQILKRDFDIAYYDSCELGGIDKSDYTEEKLHKQFVNGGIEKAVESLIKTEKGKVNILAFSVGGTIAWQFGIKSDQIDSLICVSSTRLRYETVRPNGRITLYFANNDSYKPPVEWCEGMALNCNIIIDKEHQFYRESKSSDQICKQIIEDSKNDPTGTNR